MKKIAGIALLVMVLALPAFAWGPGGRGMGRGFGMAPRGNSDNFHRNLTTEQQKKLDELHKKFQDKTAGARDEIMKKQIDLRAEINKDTPDLKKAKAIQKDINELQATISDARLEFIIEAKKIAPDMPFGMGPGMRRGMRGMRGMHRGMGPNM